VLAAAGGQRGAPIDVDKGGQAAEEDAD